MAIVESPRQTARSRLWIWQEKNLANNVSVNRCRIRQDLFRELLAELEYKSRTIERLEEAGFGLYVDGTVMYPDSRISEEFMNLPSGKRPPHLLAD